MEGGENRRDFNRDQVILKKGRGRKRSGKPDERVFGERTAPVSEIG